MFTPDQATSISWEGDPYGRFRWAEQLFEQRRYREAVRELEALLEEADQDDQPGHGLGNVHLLLARANFHAAQLKAAERWARRVLEDDPTEAYATLLLARTLQRQNRVEEAQPLMAQALAMGQQI